MDAMYSMDGSESSSPGTVLVSYDCAFLKFPGDNMVVGFVGSADNNTGTYASGAGSDALAPCGSCPGDALFDFTAQKNDEGKFVCNILAEGTVNTGSVDVMDEWGMPVPVPIPNFIDNPCALKKGDASCTYGAPDYSLFPLWQKEKEQKGEFSSMQMVVKVGLSTPFPTKKMSDNTTMVYKVSRGVTQRPLVMHRNPQEPTTLPHTNHTHHHHLPRPVFHHLSSSLNTSHHLSPASHKPHTPPSPTSPRLPSPLIISQHLSPPLTTSHHACVQCTRSSSARGTATPRSST